MRYLTEDLINFLNYTVGEDVVYGMKLMLDNGYELDNLMNMPIGQILEYYDSYYKSK